MALILCIETSTTMCSVALGRDGKLVAVKELNKGYTHAENLTLFIRDVVQEAKVEFSQLDAVAVSKGPGSYTGLRIGVSTAKGLCYALEKPLIGINTLQHLSLFVSREEKETELFCPMIDARRMEVYCAVYDKTGNEIKGVAAEIIDEHSFAGILQEKKVLFFGDGAAKCKTVLGAHPHARFLDGIFPSATSMIALAEKKFAEKKLEDVAYFEPFYLKDFVSGKKQ